MKLSNGKKLFLFFVLILMGGSFYILVSNVREPLETASDIHEDMPPRTIGKIESNPDGRDVSHSKWYLNRDLKIKIGDPLYEPKNQEMVDWLVRNGYPSYKQRELAVTGNFVESDLNANDGIDPIEILIAEQLAIRDPANKAPINYLNQAATSGSIYALESLARVYEHPNSNNPSLAMAYYKAAAMRGDWVVNIDGARYVQDGQKEMLAAIAAQQIIQNINIRRASTGLQPLGFDQRPGLNEFVLEIQNTNGAEK